MKVCPDILHSRAKTSPAECKVFDLLIKVELGPDWCAFHSLNCSEHEYKRWSELDFVLAGPDGVFVLEVKGGRIRRGQLEQELRPSNQSRLSANRRESAHDPAETDHAARTRRCQMAQASGDPVPQRAAETLHAALADTSGRRLAGHWNADHGAELSP